MCVGVLIQQTNYANIQHLRLLPRKIKKNYQKSKGHAYYGNISPLNMWYTNCKCVYVRAMRCDVMTTFLSFISLLSFEGLFFSLVCPSFLNSVSSTLWGYYKKSLGSVLWNLGMCVSVFANFPQMWMSVWVCVCLYNLFICSTYILDSWYIYLLMKCYRFIVGI